MDVLDLSVEVRAPDGTTTRWGSEDRDPEMVPRGLSFRTQRQQGFADAAVTLLRRIDRDYPDLMLLDDVSFIGADGTIAYEGRVGAAPRSFDQGQSVSLQLAGWMAHAKDRKFNEIFVDRDLGSWGPIARDDRIAHITANRVIIDPGTQVDPTSGAQALALEIREPSATRTLCDAMYDAGVGPLVDRIYADLTRLNTASPWEIRMYVGDTTTARLDPSANWSGTGTLTGITYNPGSSTRYAFLRLDNNTASDALAHTATWTKLAVYGNHGVPLIGNEPAGVAASEVIKHLAARYCPKLSTAGVQATSYPIPHLVFRERTDPYDAFLAVNAYHLWDLAVWENKTLHYGPTDLSDYDWEIRLSDPGVRVELQGDSTEQLANGIVVQYLNVSTGVEDTLTPDSYVELRDTSVENPANRAGLNMWTEYRLSIPTTKDAALQLGRTALAEFNQPKAAGSISVSHYIRDRYGNQQPAWRVRAGDRVAIVDHPNDRPRLIHETSWEQDSRTLTMSIESTMLRLDAVIDRITTALAANNLSM